MKRSLCNFCILAVTLISLSYMAGGEKVFQSLRSPYCEKITEDGKKAAFKGKVYKKEYEGTTCKLFLKHVEIDRKSVFKEKILIYISDEKSFIPKIGQWVFGYGEVRFFQTSRNPGNFNQKLYYQKQNIQLQVENAKVIKYAGRSDRIKEALFCVRSGLSKRMYELAGEEQGGILCALLLGDQSRTDEEIKEYYQKSGIGHLLAISGLHISFLGTGLYMLLRKCRISFKISAVVSIIILGLYVLMTGAGISVTRAYIMFVIHMGALIFGREYDGLTALSVAAFCIVLKNPLAVAQQSFLLSFGAVSGIYAVYPVICAEEKRTNKIRETVKMSFAIHSVLLPVTFYYFYEFNPYSFLWNLIAIPLSSFALGFGAAGVVAVGISELANLPFGMAKIFLKSAGMILAFYDKVSRWIMEWPGAHIITGKPSVIRIIMYYLLISLFLIMICLEKEKWKRQIILVLAITVLIVPGYRKKQLEITMLDIGQGDCFFMRTPEGVTHLIDGGSSTMKSPGKYAIEPFLKAQGIGSVDYVWASHGDMDHINGIEEMIERQNIGIHIKNLILIPEEFWDERIEELYYTAKRNGVSVFTTERGKVWTEKELRLLCIWPVRTDNDYESNEGSMVLSLHYGEFDMLFTGDLERRGEEKVAGWIEQNRKKMGLPEKYEVLKVGHHGSKFGTSDELLRCINPSVALISSGRKNRYGHPHQEVIERLAKRKTRIYNTKDRHAVNLYTDGKKYCILIP